MIALARSSLPVSASARKMISHDASDERELQVRPVAAVASD
jgi:hypothetical protein